MVDTVHQTCGALYHALVQQFFPWYPESNLHGLHHLIVACSQDPPAYAAFALGFMTGQCEKVALTSARLALAEAQTARSLHPLDVIGRREAKKRIR